MFYKIILLLFISFFPFQVFAWDLAKEKNGVTVHTRNVEGSELKEFRGKTKVKASLNSVLALLDDNPSYTTWLKDCKKSEAIKILNPKERYIYILNGVPWPLDDRDFIVHSTFSLDKATGAVTYTLRPAANSIVPEKKGIVRGKIKGYWKFVPKGDEVEVTYQVHSEPGGSIPSSIANFVVVDIPYETLRKMKDKLEEPKYKNAPQFHLLSESAAN
ncbi:polyketide cyclase/dehydrase [Leptospira broomii serovar Hurstbridge str. 5399]|uniref:Polyketide cyclase/dehydrase n=1 Tax=Leptospira broomii serovar Hurstbridge str. 5399 TaxID=1049789 RepID=T0GNQ8_9LEPT|nr:START domain-containing protein [Leptospira broomii]EQA46958.1 polyketide cyclase/dehydrase [Leptospira broomii serovar Hurstbridge str. 5399]